MMRFSYKIHEGRDEDTLNLLTKLNNEAIIEEEKIEQENNEKVTAATENTDKNFPPLPKAKSSNQ